MTMTIDQFLEKLASLDKKWTVDFNRLRSPEPGDDYGHCPISAVTGNLADYSDPVIAGCRLGLTEVDAKDIVYAADTRNRETMALRRRLFSACKVNTDPELRNQDYRCLY